jgi:hypothetical protein
MVATPCPLLPSKPFKFCKSVYKNRFLSAHEELHVHAARLWDMERVEVEGNEPF